MSEAVTGYKRSYSVVIRKMLNEVILSGYPKVYPTAIDMANGYFVLGGTHIPIMTASELQTLSQDEYAARIALLKDYVIQQEGMNPFENQFNTNMVYDPDNCVEVTSTTTEEPTTTTTTTEEQVTTTTTTVCTQSFILTYDNASVVDPSFSFFEMEPDYDFFDRALIEPLTATLYTGGVTITPPDPEDDYYGGLSIDMADYTETPVGINTLTATGGCGLLESIWLILIHDLRASDQTLDLSMFPNLSYLEVWRNDNAYIALPETYRTDWGFEFYIWEMPNLLEVDFSALTVLSGTNNAFQISEAPLCTSFIQPTSSYFDHIFIRDIGVSTLDLSNITMEQLSSINRLNVSECPNLTSLLIPTCTVKLRTLNISDNPSLGYVDLSSYSNLTTGSGTSLYHATYTLTGNGMTVAEVNKTLVDLDSNAVGGYTYRYIDISNNAAPDSSSGGYDGLAAKASLQAKGFTVTTD